MSRARRFGEAFGWAFLAFVFMALERAWREPTQPEGDHHD